CSYQWAGSRTSVASQMVNDMNAAIASGADGIAVAMVDQATTAAFLSGANVNVLMQYTAATAIIAAGQVLDLIRRLKDESAVSVIIVVHNYAQVFGVCNRVNLLQNGEITYDCKTKDSSIEELTDLVVN